MSEKDALDLAIHLAKQGKDVKLYIDGRGDWNVYSLAQKKERMTADIKKQINKKRASETDQC